MALVVFFLWGHVRHRIDGLEKWQWHAQAIVNVRHRIDGLEKLAGGQTVPAFVRHRIDGLENNLPFGKLSA